jgi:hypothetical protein
MNILAQVEYEEELIRRKELMGVDMNAIWRNINPEGKSHIEKSDISKFLEPLVS